MSVKSGSMTAGIVACLCLVMVGAAGCGPPIDPTMESSPSKVVAVQEPAPDLATIADTAGDIPVVWTAASGSARQDPIGLLNGTPMLLQGSHLIAKKTVAFKPNSPNAQSADGKYSYTLDLTESPSRLTFKGTMTIDWTMTIVWSATSRNEFHAVYKADVTAYYNSAVNILRDGVAKGTATTTDTGITTGSNPIPNKSTAPFQWTFESQ